MPRDPWNGKLACFDREMMAVLTGISLCNISLIVIGS